MMLEIQLLLEDLMTYCSINWISMHSQNMISLVLENKYHIELQCRAQNKYLKSVSHFIEIIIASLQIVNNSPLKIYSRYVLPNSAILSTRMGWKMACDKPSSWTLRAACLLPLLLLLPPTVYCLLCLLSLYLYYQ